MNYIPERWRKQVQSMVDHKIDSWKLTPFTVDDFIGAGSVIIKYKDGSESSFKSSFLTYNKFLKEYAIFTEHCGYHYVSENIATFMISDNESILLTINLPYFG